MGTGTEQGTSKRFAFFSTLLALGVAACSGSEHVLPPPTSAEREPVTPHPPVTAKEPVAPAPFVASEPVAVPAATAAHAAVQEQFLGGPLPDNDLVHFVPIEDSTGGALSHFHQSLRDLEAGRDPDGKVRVAVYGSSSVAADRWTGYLRGYLQQRFGDGGVGFVALVPLWRWHRHDAVRLDASKRWDIEHAQRETGRLDGHYGLLGASASSSWKYGSSRLIPKSSSISDVTATDRVDLYFLAQPGGGRFDVEQGKKTLAQVSTAAPTHQAGYATLAQAERPVPFAIDLKGDAEVRLFGAVLERDQPGVVVDELGVGGTRAANHLDWNLEIWTDNVKRRDPDLYVLAYGANEAVDEDEPIELYRQNLQAVLRRFEHTLPEASCLLVGPQDFPLQGEDEQWGPRPRMTPIVEIQREVAAAHGCGFWDSRAFMGGEGSMPAWVTADPPLAKADHLHLTKLGYIYFGRTLTDALMAAYDAG